MVMHDFKNHSQVEIVVKMDNPGGLECDSHMLKGFVLPKRYNSIQEYGWVR